MNAPGRNAKGQYVRDDKAIVETLTLLVNAVDYLTKLADQAEPSAEDREMFTDWSRSCIAEARKTIAMIDVGTKPGKEPT